MLTEEDKVKSVEWPAQKMAIQNIIVLHKFEARCLAGRMGNPGRATSFFCESDWHIAPELAELLKESNQEVPPFLAKMKYNNSAVSSGHKKSLVLFFSKLSVGI